MLKLFTLGRGNLSFMFKNAINYKEACNTNIQKSLAKHKTLPPMVATYFLKVCFGDTLPTLLHKSQQIHYSKNNFASVVITNI